MTPGQRCRLAALCAAALLASVAQDLFAVSVTYTFSFDPEAGTATFMNSPDNLAALETWPAVGADLGGSFWVNPGEWITYCLDGNHSIWPPAPGPSYPLLPYTNQKKSQITLTGADKAFRLVLEANQPIKVNDSLWKDTLFWLEPNGVMEWHDVTSGAAGTEKNTSGQRELRRISFAPGPAGLKVDKAQGVFKAVKTPLKAGDTLQPCNWVLLGEDSKPGKLSRWDDPNDYFIRAPLPYDGNPAPKDFVFHLDPYADQLFLYPLGYGAMEITTDTDYFLSTRSDWAGAGCNPIPEPLTMSGVFLACSGLSAYMRRRVTAANHGRVRYPAACRRGVRPVCPGD